MILLRSFRTSHFCLWFSVFDAMGFLNRIKLVFCGCVYAGHLFINFLFYFACYNTLYKMFMSTVVNPIGKIGDLSLPYFYFGSFKWLETCDPKLFEDTFAPFFEEKKN